MKGSPEHSKEFSYTGNLSHNPLPDMLFTITHYKVPGVLTFSLGNVIKQVFISDGRIIFAASNAPEDHLGEFLLRCGKISRVDYDKSTELLEQFRKKWQGQILIEMGALSTEELPWAVRSHQQAIVWSLFNWFEGIVKFHIGELRGPKPILLDIPIPRAILDGVRHISHAKRAIHHMGNRDTILEADKNALLNLEVFGADEKERSIMKMIDGKTSLYDLCANAPCPAHEAAKILYGFYALKLIHKKQPAGIHVVSTLPSTEFD